MYLFSFEKHNRHYNVNDTAHVNKIRDGEYNKRNKNYTNEKLHEILYIAIASMTQYRNKGDIGITFFNTEGKINALLVVLTDSEIVIKTALENTKRDANSVFWRSNHIFLKDYIFERPVIDMFENLEIKEAKQPTRNKLSIKKKQGKTVFKALDSGKEDEEFMKAMKNTKRF